jgi:simple sugar transport system permease protein
MDRYGSAINSALAILAALVVGGVILLIVGLNPSRIYFELFSRGLGTQLGIVETLIKMAPILMVSAGLILSFKAGLWNIGTDGQFLVGAIAVGWAAPVLTGLIPQGLAFLVLGALGFLGGLFWALIPALLKSRYGLNEIITTLMMNFVAINITWLVRSLERSPSCPQTAVIPSARLRSLSPNSYRAHCERALPHRDYFSSRGPPSAFS